MSLQASITLRHKWLMAAVLVVLTLYRLFRKRVRLGIHILPA